MTQSFSFRTATEILFGRGQAQAAPKRIAAFGTSVLLVHGSNPRRSAALANGLVAEGCRVTGFSVAGEPDTDVIEAGVARVVSLTSRPEPVTSLRLVGSTLTAEGPLYETLADYPLEA